MSKFFRIPVLRKNNFGKELSTCINYSLGQESKQIKCQMNFTALEKQKKSRVSDIKSYAASKLGELFWDTQYMNILSKFKYIFYCIKRQRKSKIRVQVKSIVQKRPSFSHAKQNEETSHIRHNGIPRASKISN